MESSRWSPRTELAPCNSWPSAIFRSFANLSPGVFQGLRGRRRSIKFAFPLLSSHAVGMGKRREARERAVQFLFQHDLNPPENLEQALEQFWDSQRSEEHTSEL